MYSSILVAVDLDEPDSWQKSVPTALAIGKCFGAKVGLVHVVSDVLLAVEAEWSGLALRRILETARARLGLLADELKTEAEIQAHVATGRSAFSPMRKSFISGLCEASTIRLACPCSATSNMPNASCIMPAVR